VAEERRHRGQVDGLHEAAGGVVAEAVRVDAGDAGPPAERGQEGAHAAVGVGAALAPGERAGVPFGCDPLRSALGGGLDAETEDTIRRIVREELRAAVREEIANLAAGLAAVLHPPGDELRPRRRV
jgi:hypothetical protein